MILECDISSEIYHLKIIFNNPAPAATSPAPATTFLQQQLRSCTSDYLPALAATSPTTAATSPAPVTTSPDYQDHQTCTSNPVPHRQLDPAPTTSSWILRTGVRRMIFQLRFAIIKFGLVLSFLSSALSITYISKVSEIDIFIGPAIPLPEEGKFSKWLFMIRILHARVMVNKFL